METEIKVHPFLVVNNAAIAADFYVYAFDAKIETKYTDQNRTMAKIRLGKSEFWIGDEESEYNNFSPITIGGSPVRLVLTIANPKAVFARALELGAKEICQVNVEEFWEIGKLQDPFGHIWEVGCPVTE
ncbi:MAG TPA: VOC family protein [Dyadobacter sp.]|jgi:PhnB protein|nr:VOC family protein [Dyadobacter sp.]